MEQQFGNKRARTRIPLGRTRRRLSFEGRLRIVLWLFVTPWIALLALLLGRAHATVAVYGMSFALLLGCWAVVEAWCGEQLLHPLQTLANVVAAIREGDYSFRVRGGRRGDALGDLALELNALADALQAERFSSLESGALVRRVLASIDAPVLAFDEEGFLRLLNPAGARLLGGGAALGQHAAALGVADLLLSTDEQVTTIQVADRATQWMVRRSLFREHGVPHALLLLSDISVALREEERQAWQRLIRVLGHEINNSLTPIKSLAGSLRHMLRGGEPSAEYDRPLALIEERAESLHRFLAAYRELAQLPQPRRAPVALDMLLRQLAALELRVPVQVADGPPLELLADKDQIAQAIVNLLRNGAEAALANAGRPAQVVLSWQRTPGWAVVRVSDSGLGIANPSNLFVPFYTTKEQGTGIGLVLVKQIAEGHHGSIAIYNADGGGAVAELRLPV